MIIVTGGAGFIGSNLIKYLNSQGINDIIVVDDINDPRKLNNLATLNFKRFIDVDKLDFKTIPPVVEKVFHCGAISSTTEQDGKRLMEYNYQHTLRWVNYCDSVGAKLVYLSSASVYGNSTTFNENDQFDPLNYYAVSKVLTERYIKISGNKNVWVFRPFNVYGRGEDHKDKQASPFTQFKKQFEETGSVNVFVGSQEIYRDFICVDDVVKILADYTDSSPGVYNLGTGEPRSFLEIAQLISPVIHTVQFPVELRGKYQSYSKAFMGKLRNNLIGEYKFITPEEFLL